MVEDSGQRWKFSISRNSLTSLPRMWIEDNGKFLEGKYDLMTIHSFAVNA